VIVFDQRAWLISVVFLQCFIAAKPNPFDDDIKRFTLAIGCLHCAAKSRIGNIFKNEDGPNNFAKLSECFVKEF
jgi:hypothetical protein